MSTTPNPLQFRPAPTGNAASDEAFRQILDYIYQLRSQLQTLQTTVDSLQSTVAKLST